MSKLTRKDGHKEVVGHLGNKKIKSDAKAIGVEAIVGKVIDTLVKMAKEGKKRKSKHQVLA